MTIHKRNKYKDSLHGYYYEKELRMAINSNNIPLILACVYGNEPAHKFVIHDWHFNNCQLTDNCIIEDQNILMVPDKSRSRSRT